MSYICPAKILQIRKKIKIIWSLRVGYNTHKVITSNKSDINVHFNLQIFLLQPHPIEPFKQDCINQKQVGSH